MRMLKEAVTRDGLGVVTTRLELRDMYAWLDFLSMVDHTPTAMSWGRFGRLSTRWRCHSS